MTFGFTMLLITQILLVVGTGFLLWSMWSAARDVRLFIQGKALAVEVRRPVVSVFKSWTTHLQSGFGLWFNTLAKRSPAVMASLQAKGLTMDQAKHFQQWLTKTNQKQLNELLEAILRDSFFAKKLHLERWYRLTIMVGLWLIFQIVALVILIISHTNLLTEILIAVSVIGEFVVMFRSMSVNDSLNFQGQNLEDSDRNKLVLQFNQWSEELQAVYRNVLWQNTLVHNMSLNSITLLKTKISLLSFLMLKLVDFEGQEAGLHDFLTIIRLHLGDGDLLGEMQVLNEFWMESKLDYQTLDDSLRQQIDTALDDLNAALDQSVVQLVAVTISAEESAQQNVLLKADKSKMSSEDLNLYYQRKLDQQEKLKDLENNNDKSAKRNDN